MKTVEEIMENSEDILKQYFRDITEYHTTSHQLYFDSSDYELFATEQITCRDWIDGPTLNLVWQTKGGPVLLSYDEFLLLTTQKLENMLDATARYYEFSDLNEAKKIHIGRQLR